MKVIKLTFDCIDDNGNKVKRTLEGADAQEWYENNIFLCQFAEEHGLNPKWHKLRWKQIVSQQRKPKGYENAVLLEDILGEKDKK